MASSAPKFPLVIEPDRHHPIVALHSSPQRIPTQQPLLQCACGSLSFHVSPVDFICTTCGTSHKD